MTSVWLYTFYQGHFFDLGFMAELKRDGKMTFYDYEVAFFFFFWIETGFLFSHYFVPNKVF